MGRVLYFLGCIALSGCVTYPPPDHPSGIRHSGETTVAVLEFTRNGEPVSEERVAAIGQLIDAIPDQSRALVVLFVHGWRHDASASDPHFIKFGQALSDVAATVPNRKVIGIYVSWPAKSLRMPLGVLTFLDRSWRANLVSTAAGTRTTLQKFQSAIEQRREHADIVTVAIGHSLGGKFLFSPMEARLESKDVAQQPEKAADLPLFGALTLLVNPAQDVHDFEIFEAFAAHGDAAARPVMITFSSESDRVMQVAFRIGRFIRNIFKIVHDGPDFRAEMTGLGWRASQVTHRLQSVGAEDPRRAGCGQRTAIFDIRDQNNAQPLDRLSGAFPVIRVDKCVLNGHSGMFDPTFIGFLVELVAQRSRAPDID